MSTSGNSANGTVVAFDVFQDVRAGTRHWQFLGQDLDRIPIDESTQAAGDD